MNQDFQQQFDKINHFNENDSKKMVELKKLINSKWGLGLLIGALVCVISLFLINLVNQLSLLKEINITNVVGLIADGLLNSIFPCVFIVLLLSIMNKAKKEKTFGRDSLMNKLFSLRSFASFYFVITIIGNLLNGISYSNLESLKNISPDYYNILVTSDTDLAMYKSIGLYFLIQTCFASCIWFALSRFSKNLLQSIIFDENKIKEYDLYIFIGLSCLQALLEVVGLIISLVGYTNPLTTVYFVPPIVPVDFLLIGYFIIVLLFTIYMSLIFIKIYRIIRDNNGSINPLSDSNNVVYTIHLDEEGK